MEHAIVWVVILERIVLNHSVMTTHVKMVEHVMLNQVQLVILVTASLAISETNVKMTIVARELPVLTPNVTTTENVVI